MEIINDGKTKAKVIFCGACKYTIQGPDGKPGPLPEPAKQPEKPKMEAPDGKKEEKEQPVSEG